MQQRLHEILYFFRTNLGALLAVTLPFAAAAAFVVHLHGEPVVMGENEQPAIQWTSAVILSLLYPLGLGVKLVAIHRLAGGQGLALGAVLAEALRLWPVLAGIGLVLGFAVGVGLLVLFVIPGAWLYARLGLAPILAVTEGRGVMDALAGAWQRSRETQFDLFMITLLLGAVVVLVMVGVFYAVGRVDASTSLAADLTARAVNELLFCLLSIAFYRYWSLGRPGNTP